MVGAEDLHRNVKLVTAQLREMNHGIRRCSHCTVARTLFCKRTRNLKALGGIAPELEKMLIHWRL